MMELIERQSEAKVRFERGYRDAVSDILNHKRRSLKAEGGPENTDKIVSKEADLFYYEGYRRGRQSYWYAKDTPPADDWWEMLKLRTTKAMLLRIDAWFNAEYLARCVTGAGEDQDDKDHVAGLVEEIRQIAVETRAVL
jgi:hypothetical protein